jgi:hypothetical protein
MRTFAPGSMRRVQDRVVGIAQPTDEAIGDHRPTQRRAVHQLGIQPHGRVALLLGRERLHLGFVGGQADAAILLEVAVDAVSLHEFADLVGAQQCGVVVGARRFGAGLLEDRVQPRHADVGEAAVAPTGAVAAGGPLQQHDALARKTLDQVVGGGHARVAAADDGDVGPLLALEWRVDDLAVEPRRLEPEAVHEELVELRRTFRIPQREVARQPGAGPHSHGSGRHSGGEGPPRDAAGQSGLPRSRSSVWSILSSRTS